MRIFATNYIFREDVLFLPILIRMIRAVDFLRALCLIDAFFRLAFHRCSLSFRSRFASCATFYTLSRFFRRFFKSSLSLRPLPSLSSLFMSYLYRHPCLYLFSTLRSRSIFILPLHALFRLPSSTRFTLDLPPSRSHTASLQLSWIRLCFSVIVLFLLVSTAASVSLQYHSSRRVLFLQPCSLSSSIILPELYPSHSLSFSPSYLPPTHMHPPPSSSAGSVRIGPAR